VDACSLVATDTIVMQYLLLGIAVPLCSVE